MVKLLHRSAVLFFCLFLVFTIAAPAAARQGNEAGEEARDKVVRVGWFESPFNTIDKSGRRSGYGYEYQLKLAAYTGWTYQYISGSWTELLQMLEKGEIDLEGKIDSLAYSDVTSYQKQGESLIGRLFK